MPITNCKKSKSQPSPPLLSSNTPQRPDELLPSKKLVKRPILQFEGTSCFRVGGFRPFLALPRVVSFFRCFWNRPLLKTSPKPRAAWARENVQSWIFLVSSFSFTSHQDLHQKQGICTIDRLSLSLGLDTSHVKHYLVPTCLGLPMKPFPSIVFPLISNSDKSKNGVYPLSIWCKTSLEAKSGWPIIWGLPTRIYWLLF